MVSKPRPDKDEAYLDDIRQSCGSILGYVKGKFLPDFAIDHILQDAVVHRLFIIGEASKKLTSKARAKYPGVPWTEIIRLRDLTAHHYWTLELPAIWDYTQKDVPELLNILLDVGP